MELASVKKFEKPESGSDLELRSCPFCGGSEVVYAMYNRLALGERWAVICMDCMAEIDPGWAQTKSAVQAMWNRRVSLRKNCVIAVSGTSSDWRLL